MKPTRRIALTAAVASVLTGCGADHGSRPPTPAERAAIVHWIKYWWRVDPQFAAARIGRHPVVKSIRVSRRDGHFASAQITPLNGQGKQTLETSDAALMLAGGEWYVILDGTDLSPICSGPSPQAIVDLLCHR
jgi:hypothetical protein